MRRPPAAGDATASPANGWGHPRARPAARPGVELSSAGPAVALQRKTVAAGDWSTGRHGAPPTKEGTPMVTVQPSTDTKTREPRADGPFRVVFSDADGRGPVATAPTSRATALEIFADFLTPIEGMPVCAPDSGQRMRVVDEWEWTQILAAVNGRQVRDEPGRYRVVYGHTDGVWLSSRPMSLGEAVAAAGDVEGATVLPESQWQRGAW